MPFDLTWEAHGVYRRYRGAVTIAERERSFDLICGDPRFDGLHYALTDYLEVSDYEVSETATEEIAARHIAPMQINPRIVIAAVAVDPRIVAAIEHFISLSFVAGPYRVFATEQAARDWIAVQRPVAGPLRPR